VNEEARTFSINGTTVKYNEWITIDGGTGRVIVGEVPLVPPAINEDFETILEWADELRALGVFWLDEGPQSGPQQGFRRMGGGVPVTLTRLHVRYDNEHFPEDLAFQETGDQQSFQGRYVIRHPWRGDATCSAAAEYRDRLKERRRREAETVASLTGWEPARIHKRMGPDAPPANDPWWKKLWR